MPRELCVTCLSRLGRPRATVLRAVVCGPCWAAHGGSPAAGEIGPSPTETVTSCDPAGQGHWLRALRRQPWVQTVRVDGQRNLLTVARLVALYAWWDTLESRPTWAKLIQRSGLSERTVARWLQELRVRGWLAHLEHGSTPTTRPMALALEGNRAALYGLRIPLTPEEALTRAGEALITALQQLLDQDFTEPTPDAEPPHQTEGRHPQPTCEQGESEMVGEENGSLPKSFQVFNQRIVGGLSRASTPVDNSPDNTPDPAKTQRSALRAGSDQQSVLDLSIMVPVSGYEMLAAADWLRARLPVFARCSRKLARHLCKPYWRAGWCNRDIIHAIDHRPSVFAQPAGVLLSPEHPASPAQFVRSRLGAWRTPDGVIRAGHWGARVTDAAAAKAIRRRVIERHGHAGARLLRAEETTLSAQRIAEHAQLPLHRAANSPATAAAAPPLRPRDRRERDQRRTELVAHARAELARLHGCSAPLPSPGTPKPEAADHFPANPTPPSAASTGASVHQRALARARAEHATARLRRRRPR